MHLVIAVRQHNVQLYCLQLADCNTGAYAGFLRGPNLKKNWAFGYTWCEQRSCELLLGGFGSMPHPPKKIYKNGAISYVLRAIFHHFHDEKSSKKIINKQYFFH